MVQPQEDHSRWRHCREQSLELGRTQPVQAHVVNGVGRPKKPIYSFPVIQQEPNPSPLLPLVPPWFHLFHGAILINLFLLPCHKWDTHSSIFISSLLPTTNLYCLLSLFHVLCGLREFLERMNRLFNAGQLHRLTTVFPPVLQTFILLFSFPAPPYWPKGPIRHPPNMSNEAVFQNLCVCCSSCLEFHGPFIFPYWNLMFPATPNSNPFPYDCLSPILLKETDLFSQKS